MDCFLYLWQCERHPRNFECRDGIGGVNMRGHPFESDFTLHCIILTQMMMVAWQRVNNKFAINWNARVEVVETRVFAEFFTLRNELGELSPQPPEALLQRGRNTETHSRGGRDVKDPGIVCTPLRPSPPKHSSVYTCTSDLPENIS
ncbi:hypothetical protein CEXT_136081 [Caerostris extrusa]|uniref:Uncharacterized protein n=1 Tax=Caerostris extrusa TaxID=172846 RepID=A0AAV4RLE6_CAEEX|nr:hypothetical protein CEXT_136081 [Caerostris extrusa]